MNCVLVALTHEDGKKDVSKAVAMARDLAEPRDADVRVLQVVEDIAERSTTSMAVGMEAVRVPEMGSTRLESQIFLTDDPRGCIETCLERLDPLALVLARDRFRWAGGGGQVGPVPAGTWRTASESRSWCSTRTAHEQ